ncbi:MAG TPA: hypothetical protein PLT66_09330, partial [Bacillota bacterium]|nr:hypothetical protein [Bacillota bacterium]
MKPRLFIFIMIFALLWLSFGCDGSTETSHTVSVGETASVGDTTSAYDAGLPDDLDYEGELFTILSSYGGDISTVVNPFFGGNGDYESTVVNEAVIERNRKVEETLHVT